MMAVGEHQLTVSRIWTAMSMLGRRTGRTCFCRGPIAMVNDHPPPPSSDHHQPSRNATLGFVNWEVPPAGLHQGHDLPARGGGAAATSHDLPSPWPPNPSFSLGAHRWPAPSLPELLLIPSSCAYPTTNVKKHARSHFSMRRILMFQP